MGGEKDGAVVLMGRENSGAMPQVYNGNLSIMSMWKPRDKDDYDLNWAKYKFGKQEKNMPIKIEIGPLADGYAMDRLKALFKACADLIAEAEGNLEKPPV